MSDANNQPTFFFYDFETFGTSPSLDRPCQFAGIRTDSELNIIGEPLVLYCKPTDDYLPQPEACLITGITPQTAKQKACRSRSLLPVSMKHSPSRVPVWLAITTFASMTK